MSGKHWVSTQEIVLESSSSIILFQYYMDISINVPDSILNKIIMY